jgi:hypothetical protein
MAYRLGWQIVSKQFIIEAKKKKHYAHTVKLPS